MKILEADTGTRLSLQDFLLENNHALLNSKELAIWRAFLDVVAEVCRQKQFLIRGSAILQAVLGNFLISPDTSLTAEAALTHPMSINAVLAPLPIIPLLPRTTSLLTLVAEDRQR